MQHRAAVIPFYMNALHGPEQMTPVMVQKESTRLLGKPLTHSRLIIFAPVML